MRTPLEYGDNFPVPTGSWNPAEPWRFPKHEVLSPQRGMLRYALPWITLGLGVSLGILWMSWRTELVKPQPQPEAGLTGIVPRSAPASSKPVRLQVRSELA